MIGDTPRDLLLWLGDPEGTREQWDEGTWSAFRNRCRQEYGFDPESRRRDRRRREARAAQGCLVRRLGAVRRVAGAVSGDTGPVAAGQAEGEVDLREGTLAGRKRRDGESAAGGAGGGRLDEAGRSAAAPGAVGGRARPAPRLGMGAAGHVPAGQCHWRIWRCWPSGPRRRWAATRPMRWPSCTPRAGIWPTTRVLRALACVKSGGRHRGRPGGGAMRVSAVAGRHGPALPGVPGGEGPADGGAAGKRRSRERRVHPVRRRAAVRHRPAARGDGRRARQIGGVHRLALGGAAHGDGDGQAGGVAGCRARSAAGTWMRTSARRWPTQARG